METIEKRVRDLEIQVSGNRKDIDNMQITITEEKIKRESNEDAIDLIEKAIIKIETPLKAILWTATVLISAIILLIWSLVIGKAEIIFR